jgi:hypothetical protein
VKNHNFTPKNHIFSNSGEGAKIVGVFRVKNHDFMSTNHIFSNLGGGADDFLLGPRYIGDDFFFRVDRSLGAKQEGPMIVHF